jgi:hypothetical protein
VIVWSCTNTNVSITNDTALFRRPSHDENDVMVNLVAIISRGTNSAQKTIQLSIHHLPGWRTIAVTEKRSGGLSSSYPLPLACNAAGEIFLTYNSTSYNSGIYVCKLEGTNLTPLGGAVDNLDGATAHALILDASGDPVLAYQGWGNSHRAEVHRYSGSAWGLVGSAGISTGEAHWNVLASGNGLLYHGCQDTVDSKVWVRAWDGSTWSVLGGAAVSSGNADQLSMAVDGEGHPWVAYYDRVSYLLGVMRWSGSNWQAVATNTASSGPGKYSSMIRRGDGSMAIAFQDYLLPKRVLRVINWDGTAWQQLGQTIDIEPQHTSLVESPAGVPYLAWIPVVAGQPSVTRVDRLEGGQWVTLPAAGLSVTNTYASRLLFDNDGRLWMASTDSALDYRVRLMRYVE